MKVTLKTLNSLANHRLCTQLETRTLRGTYCIISVSKCHNTCTEVDCEQKQWEQKSSFGCRWGCNSVGDLTVYIYCQTYKPTQCICIYSYGPLSLYV